MNERDAIDLSDSMAHLLIEAGIVPGVSCTCRCEQCKQVAEAMDGAGYLDQIQDRWWSASPEGEA